MLKIRICNVPYTKIERETGWWHLQLLLTISNWSKCCVWRSASSKQCTHEQYNLFLWYASSGVNPSAGHAVHMQSVSFISVNSWTHTFSPFLGVGTGRTEEDASQSQLLPHLGCWAWICWAVKWEAHFLVIPALSLSQQFVTHRWTQLEVFSAKIWHPRSPSPR